MRDDITRAQVCAALRLPEGCMDFTLGTFPGQARLQFYEACEVTVVDLNSLAALFETFDVRVTYDAASSGEFTFGIDIYDSWQCDGCDKTFPRDMLTDTIGGHTDSTLCDPCRLER